MLPRLFKLGVLSKRLAAILTMVFAPLVAHALTQTMVPTNCSNVTGIGTKAWSNPTRAYSSNNKYSTRGVDGTTTNYLRCVGYGFTIPTSATINGITIDVERKSNRTTNGGSQDAAVRLVKAGAIGTTDRKTTTIYTTSDFSEAHGGSADLWGTTWTPADINDSAFGAAFAATKSSSAGKSHTISVDLMSITVTFTDTGPLVSSINRGMLTPSAATSVTWTVIFDRSVSGVNAADFSLVPGGSVTGASISSVTGSGTTWTVTANTGSGSGTLGLNLIDDDTIVDGSGIKLGGTGTGNGNFTGQVYSIDKGNTLVSIISRTGATPTNASSVSWTVTFSASVSGVNTASPFADFALAATGITGASITSIVGSGTTYTVTASTGSGSGTLGLNLVDDDTIIDGSSNRLGGIGAGNGNATGEIYAIDRMAPVITSIARAGASPTTDNVVNWNVVFSRSVSGVDLSDFSLAISGVSGAFLSDITGSGTNWIVTANTGIGSGTLGLNLVDDDSILDTLSNKLGGSGTGNGNFTGDVYTISDTPPMAGYRFDENSWNGTADEVADVSVDLPGTAKRTANTTDSARALIGDPGTCRYGAFSISSKTFLELDSGFPHLSEDFAVTAWIKTADNTKSNQWIFADHENGNGYALSLGDPGNGRLRFITKGYANLDSPNSAGSVLASNTWYFVAAVADFSGATNVTRRLYVFDTTGTLLSGYPVSDAVIPLSSWPQDSGLVTIGGKPGGSSGNNFGGNLDEVMIYDKLLTQSALAALATRRHACSAVAVDHYQVSVPATNLACLPSTITISACANAPCTTKSTTISGQTALLATNAGNLGATSLTFDALGDATTTLSYSGAGNGAAATLTLSGETVAATNARTCCIGASCSTSNTCAATFNTSGFIISDAAGGPSATIPTQTAGTYSSLYQLRAIRSGTTTAACEGALTGANSVNLGYSCNNPSSCSSGNLLYIRPYNTAAAQTAIAVAPGTSAATLYFDANGNAPFDFHYRDVGQIALTANKAAGGSLLTSMSLSGTNGFVVKPATIVATGTSPAINTANPFVAAGASFNVTVEARDSLGNVTPNFGKESPTEAIKLTASVTTPAGGSNGTLSGSVTAFTNGAGTGTFSWDEVGIANLTPSIADGDYLGDTLGLTVGNVIGTAFSAGRFFPHHFTVTPGVLTPGCSSGGFTYMGQGFSFYATLSARSAANATTGGVEAITTNYGKTGYSPLQTSGLAVVAENNANGTNLNTSGRVTAVGGGALSLPSLNWSTNANGTANVGTSLSLVSAEFSRTARDGPYDALRFGLQLAQTEATSPPTTVATVGDMLTTTAGSVSSSTSSIRYGRLAIQNAYGSELLSLPVALTAQYCSAGCSGSTPTWSTNTLHGSTCPISVSSTFPSAITYAPTLASGVGTQTLPAPGSGNSGTSVLSSTQAWLPGSGRATFGRYKAPYIYLREIY